MPKRTKWYVGHYTAPNGFRGHTWFGDRTPPTAMTYGHIYTAITGPFKTKRGAIYMANNPNTPSVADAEHWAKVEAGK